MKSLEFKEKYYYFMRIAKEAKFTVTPDITNYIEQLESEHAEMLELFKTIHYAVNLNSVQFKAIESLIEKIEGDK